MALKTVYELPAVKRYIDRIGAKVNRMLGATIEVKVGKYFKEIGFVKFTKEGEIECTHGYEPTPEEADNIRHALKNADWPVYRFIIDGEKLPKIAQEAKENDVFFFRDTDKNIVMIQVRVENKKGQRSYVPFTQYTDNEWRAIYPDGDYPLWGMENLTDDDTVIIHEGAKAARAMQRMIEQKTREDKEAYARHPWAAEMDNAVHLGFIGGAYATQKTDWGQLKKRGVKRVYIIADNDKAGKSVVPRISKGLDLPCFWIQFTDEFPTAFDMADQWPKDMFRTINGKEYYTGPTFDDLLQFGTWATDLVPDPTDDKGKRMLTVLRDCFRDEWFYLDNQMLFVCHRKPEMVYTEKQFNNFCSGWAHTNELAKKVLARRVESISRQTYRPDIERPLVTDDGVAALNMYRKPKIRAVPGDITPFTQFMEYLIPEASERHQVYRWCATLIARPDIRMRYALLLVSEAQGIGKTTLGNSILAPIIGHENVSIPTNDDMKDKYNGYAAMKRLVIVDEFFSNREGYNTMKSLISDDTISIRKMYADPISIKNWAHVFATSNHMDAIKLDPSDRRWLIPKVSENRWTEEKFSELNDWLESGGLSIVKFWAEQFGDYVRTSERAPMSSLKAEMIEEARPPAQRKTYRLASVALGRNEQLSMSAVAIERWVQDSEHVKTAMSNHQLLRPMVEAGMTKSPWRVSLGGLNQYLMMTPQLVDAIAGLPVAEQKEMVRSVLMQPEEVLKFDI